jgi:hypothetical protein
MVVTIAEVDPGSTATWLDPEEFTVTAPVLLLVITYDCPSTNVLVTGRVTVCVVVPVKYCCRVEPTVNVVVPAAVTVVVYPSNALFILIFAFASRVTRVLAVAALATPEPVASPVIAGVVSAGEVIVCTPVKVCPASVRAMVAEVDGKVMVVLSVPVRVMELLAVNVLPAAMFKVFVPFAVMVKPFVVVGVIAPRVTVRAPSEFDADTPLAVVTRLTRVPVVAGKV